MSTTALPSLPSQSFPAPVSPALGAKLDAAGRKVPVGKTGAVDAAVTLKGAELSVGYRLKPEWTVGAWVGKEWRGGFDGGIRLTGTW